MFPPYRLLLFAFLSFVLVNAIRKMMRRRNSILRIRCLAPARRPVIAVAHRNARAVMNELGITRSVRFASFMLILSLSLACLSPFTRHKIYATCFRRHTSLDPIFDFETALTLLRQKCPRARDGKRPACLSRTRNHAIE